MEIIVLGILFLVMFPLMGLISLVALNSFAWLYVVILGLLFIIQIKIPKDIRNITMTVLSLGVIMMWLSLFLSYQELPNANDLSRPIAIGGFPITVFEYPPGALGNDEPPIDSWGLFYLNLGFWIIIGAVIAILLRKYLNRKIFYTFFITSIVISIFGLGYLFIKFD